MIANIENALKHGQRRGIVRADVDAEAAATFILASVEGAIGLAKSTRSAAVLDPAMREARRYLSSLRQSGRTREGEQH
jgi:hypothetical protein